MTKEKLNILFINDDYIIVNKKPGMLVIPDRYDATKPNLVGHLKSIYPEVFIVHRIDRDTSGVICFAFNAKAHKHLSQLFESRKVDKSYWALTSLAPHPSADTINIPILESKTKRKMVCHPKGKEAISHYKTIEVFNSIALLEVKIETGRTHQIRVHLSEINCPLLVDAKYGRSDAFYLSHLKGRKYNRKKEQLERPLMNRHSLHARSIKFIDLNNDIIEVSADLPKDFKAVLNQLRKFS